ncbi:uncharacterized protein LMH87_008839 [Akanthomyces muscarius]|uniref:Uncharacterized protein n=1 Tax=Akanthomyces muscarius TaxID=2231603 RepID=A0A9W8QHN7_AKAMU|nr:uncharacterized protein LMH87_008839 [Akanthomyces muscarius]KAJ4158307.1 hypothetical protein LMH87_008839 [Akanthomyces muscarius]
MDAASLHDGLRTKLNHLEAKLELYRQDLLSEFHQHYHELTHNASPSAVANIQDSLSSIFYDYKGLRPCLPQHPPTPAAPAPASQSAGAPAESPPPQVNDSPETATTPQTLLLAPLPADSGNSDAPGSPRDRDHELQGLFTPSYLPLLVASPIPAHDTPISPTDTIGTAVTTSQQSSVAADSPKSAETGRLPATESSIDNSTPNTSMGHPAEEDRFPGRLTTASRRRPSESEAAEAATADDGNSSASSDKGDNKAPRSALRRSSSIYKSPQSPRRVRFEFMGAEFLPTASPQPSDTMMPRSSSPMWEGENVTVDSVLGDDDSDDDLGPPPKKISSSDALRALSREPLEEGTVWTVVNPDSDNAVTHKMQQVDLDKSPAKPATGLQQIQQQPSNNRQAVDDDALDMKKMRAATPAPVSKPSASTSKATPKNKTSLNDSDIRDDDDDMFQFEDEGGKTASQQRPPASEVEDEPSDDENDRTTSASDKGLSSLRSPTTVPPASVPAAKPEPAEPTTPTTTRFHVGSVGSYKGRSIIMPVVKNPEVHAKAASIGNFNSFVGGLDGTSGMDPADLSSYRASVRDRDGFTGTPRSFTERLMMEDMEAERLQEEASQQQQ